MKGHRKCSWHCVGPCHSLNMTCGRNGGHGNLDPGLLPAQVSPVPWRPLTVALGLHIPGSGCTSCCDARDLHLMPCLKSKLASFCPGSSPWMRLSQ